MARSNGSRKPRNFDDEFPVSQEEGPSFVLGGHEFHAKKNLHPSWFLAEKKGLDQMVDFISKALTTEDRQCFVEMVYNPDTNVSTEQLGEIVSYILSEVSGKDDKGKKTGVTSA